MAMERVIAVVQRAAQDTGFSSVLGHRPDRLQSALGLTDAHVAALRSAAAFAAPLTAPGDAGGLVPDSATLYPPEGTGTMDPGYVVLPAPVSVPAPYSPPPPPLGVAPKSAPTSPPGPVPRFMPPYGPVPQIVPPFGGPRVSPGIEPARSPVPATPPTAPSVAPPCPAAVIPAPGPCAKSGPSPSTMALPRGVPPRLCGHDAIAAIVATVSETAIPAIAAITAIACSGR
jgi:hypothetical protein